MTDKQFKTIPEMVDMILDGCKDLAEAREKVKKLIQDLILGLVLKIKVAQFGMVM